MKTTPNIETLLRRAQRGDLAAFEQLMLLHEQAIFNYLYRLVNNRADAEDLTQETFIKFYHSIRRVDPTRKFSSWLYRVATNTAYDWLRKKRGHRELFIIDDPNHPFETISSSNTYKAVEGKIDIERALGMLKPIYRTILLLHYTHGLRYQEIAEIMDMPLNTVKTHLRRAKAELGQIINYG